MDQRTMFGMEPDRKQYRALTIDAWWAWAIAHGPKRVENRGWQTHYRGPLLIHAGLTDRRDRQAIEAIEEIAPWLLARQCAPGNMDQHRGRVLAVAELVDCLPIEELERKTQMQAGKFHNPWAFGPWCWVLERVRPLPTPIPVKGLQGLWCPGIALLQQVEQQLGALAR